MNIIHGILDRILSVVTLVLVMPLILFTVMISGSEALFSMFPKSED